MKKNDCILIVSIIAVALICFSLIPKKSGDIARITVDGELFATVSLKQNQKIDIKGTNVAVVENGEIFMESATCPDKLCVNQGKISDSSKKIVCLPNKVIIEATGESDVDAVVR